MTACPVTMPSDFPLSEYEAIHERVTTKSGSSPAAREQFAGGWNGLAFRFRAYADHDESFTDSILRAGDAPPPPERYLQERELFGFFVAGLASLESLCFALFNACSILKPSDFPTATSSNLKAINPMSTATALRRAYPGETVAAILQQILDSKGFTEWSTIRNVLAHRAAPGRAIYAGNVGTPPDAEWKVGIPINSTTTATRRHWLSGEITSILRAAQPFAATYF